MTLTGYGRPEDIERAHDAGVDAHLVKPVDLPRPCAFFMPGFNTTLMQLRIDTSRQCAAP